LKDDSHDELNVEKLVQQAEDAVTTQVWVKPAALRRITYHADPHIEGRKIKGRTYYYYRRGADTPMYLGSADTILKAVKIASGKNRL